MGYVKVSVSDDLLKALNHLGFRGAKKVFFRNILEKVVGDTDESEVERRVKSIILGDFDVCFFGASQGTQQSNPVSDKSKVKLTFDDLRKNLKGF